MFLVPSSLVCVGDDGCIEPWPASKRASVIHTRVKTVLPGSKVCICHDYVPAHSQNGRLATARFCKLLQWNLGLAE